MTIQERKREEWRKRVDQAVRHPGGMAEYARELGIPVGDLYSWKRRLSVLGKSDSSVIRSETFCRVAVVEPERSNLPDPKWVAEVILALHLGGR